MSGRASSLVLRDSSVTLPCGQAGGSFSRLVAACSSPVRDSSSGGTSTLSWSGRSGSSMLGMAFLPAGGARFTGSSELATTISGPFRPATSLAARVRTGPCFLAGCGLGRRSEITTSLKTDPTNPPAGVASPRKGHLTTSAASRKGVPVRRSRASGTLRHSECEEWTLRHPIDMLGDPVDSDAVGLALAVE